MDMVQSSEQQWSKITVLLGESFVDAAQDLLEEAGIEDYVFWKEERAETACLSFYRETESDLSVLKSTVQGLFASRLADARVVIAEEVVVQEDWQNSWKSFFHAERLSEHIVVRPSWEEWQRKDGDIEVVIDPGMSFGTGLHETTRACIRFLDRLALSGGAMLDAGCGSGILSIAAVKLGFAPVAAIDNDPVAVECAGRNFAENGVEDCIKLSCTPLDELKAGVRFELVVVNILAPVIKGNAGLLVSCLAPVKGRLVLAGILNSQFDDIADSFAGFGLRLEERVDDGEWSSGLFVQRPDSGSGISPG